MHLNMRAKMSCEGKKGLCTVVVNFNIYYLQFYYKGM